MKKLWLIRGPTIFALFVVVALVMAPLIAPTMPAIAATAINDQIIAQDATARHGPSLVVAQSEKNFKFYEVAIAAAIVPGPAAGQKSDLLGAKNTFFEKADLSLRAPSGLRNDTAIICQYIYGRTTSAFEVVNYKLMGSVVVAISGSVVYHMLC